jgi:hypothetical protein
MKQMVVGQPVEMDVCVRLNKKCASLSGNWFAQQNGVANLLTAWVIYCRSVRISS